jgi:AbrB family looped-hinge helix DNA binding protein
MAMAQSRVTAQGQVSVPADVRKALGIGPGSILEWEQDGDKVVVRRAGKYTFDDIHRALFGDKKIKRQSLKAMNQAKARYASARYVRSVEKRPLR